MSNRLALVTPEDCTSMQRRGTSVGRKAQRGLQRMPSAKSPGCPKCGGHTSNAPCSTDERFMYTRRDQWRTVVQKILPCAAHCRVLGAVQVHQPPPRYNEAARLTKGRLATYVSRSAPRRYSQGRVLGCTRETKGQKRETMKRRRCTVAREATTLHQRPPVSLHGGGLR